MVVLGVGVGVVMTLTAVMAMAAAAGSWPTHGHHESLQMSGMSSMLLLCVEANKIVVYLPCFGPIR